MNLVRHLVPLTFLTFTACGPIEADELEFLEEEQTSAESELVALNGVQDVALPCVAKDRTSTDSVTAGTDGIVRWRPAFASGAWTSLGNVGARRVAAAKNGSLLFIGAVTASGSVVLRSRTTSWSAWSAPMAGLGGTATDLALTVAPAGSTFVLFVTRSDGVVRSSTWTAATSWSAWTTLPTPPSGAARISATQTDPLVQGSTLMVAALGKNGAIYTIEKPGSNPWGTRYCNNGSVCTDPGAWTARSATGWASDVSMCASLYLNSAIGYGSVTTLAASRPTQRVWTRMSLGTPSLGQWFDWKQFTQAGGEGSNTVSVSKPARGAGGDAMQSISGTTLHSTN